MIIQRAFVREVLQTSGAVSTILLSIFLVTRIVSFLRDAAAGDIAIDSVFMLLMLKMISTLDVLIPIIIFISMLMVLGRWVRDNEMTVIIACGMSVKYFLPAISILAVIVCSIVAILTLYLAPLADQSARAIAEDFRTQTDISIITPGVFTETQKGLGVYFVESQDKKTDTYHNVFIYNAGQELDSVVVADSAYKTVDKLTNDDFLVLKNGSQYRGNAGEIEYSIVNFETYAVLIKQRERRNKTLPLKATPTIELWDMDHPSAAGELHWRFSKIITIPVLMLLALCFSSISYRRKRFPGMINALLLFFAYSNLLGLTLALIRRGIVPANVGLWVVHLCFLLLAIYLFSRRVQNKSLIPGFGV